MQRIVYTVQIKRAALFMIIAYIDALQNIQFVLKFTSTLYEKVV